MFNIGLMEKLECIFSGRVSQTFGVKECDEELLKIYRDHTDPKQGFWIKDPNETKKNEKNSRETRYN